MTDLYRNAGRAWLVRLVMFASLIGLAVALWAAWESLLHYGLRPADGGRLASLPVRLAWAVSLAALGLAFAGGMWVYGKVYVVRLGHDEAAGTLHARTLGFFADEEQVFPLAAVGGGSYHAGHSNSGGVSVNAAWMTLRVAGRRLPFILDAKGAWPDYQKAQALLGLA
jgi:TMEM70/TMEM186/TMEM223 protein family